MKAYELTYIITPEIGPKEAEEKAREIESYVQGNEGVILKQTNPIARTLAYPIKKSASGFIGVLEFEMEPEKLSELQGSLSKDEKIIRQMATIKRPLRIEKKLRTKIKSQKPFEIEKPAKEVTETDNAKNITKEKVELKDIEKKLDELLGE